VFLLSLIVVPILLLHKIIMLHLDISMATDPCQACKAIISSDAVTTTPTLGLP
jgi:hypothetical protein